MRARQQIVGPISDTAFCGFSAPCERNGDTGHVAIAGAEPAKSNSRIFYARPGLPQVRVEFLTPPPHSSNRQYVFWPDPQLVFQSRAKYGAVSSGESPILASSPEIRSVGSPRAFRVASAPVRGRRRVFRPTSPADSPSAVWILCELYPRRCCGFQEFSGCGDKASMGMGRDPGPATGTEEKALPSHEPTNSSRP